MLQVDARPGDVTGNVERVATQVRRHGPDADLVVATELVTTGYDLELFRNKDRELAEPLDGLSVRALSEVAAEADVTLVAGVLELADDHVYDSMVTITPDGKVTSYRKTHLYPPELDCFASGDTLGVVPTPAGRLGPLICFEHAFPRSRQHSRSAARRSWSSHRPSPWGTSTCSPSARVPAPRTTRSSPSAAT